MDWDARAESGRAEPAVEGEKSPKAQKPRTSAMDEEEEKAIELDSSDPDIMLELAKAHISTADHDAARQILEEVLEVGNDAQIRKARGFPTNRPSRFCRSTICPVIRSRNISPTA